MRRKIDGEPGTPTDITADHGHRNWNGDLTDTVRFDLPVKFENKAKPASAVVIWTYDNGDCGIALYPWRPKQERI